MASSNESPFFLGFSVNRISPLDESTVSMASQHGHRTCRFFLSLGISESISHTRRSGNNLPAVIAAENDTGCGCGELQDIRQTGGQPGTERERKPDQAAHDQHTAN